MELETIIKSATALHYSSLQLLPKILPVNIGVKILRLNLSRGEKPARIISVNHSRYGTNAQGLP